MAKKQETVLTDVAEKIGSTLGIVAAEAAKIVRPLGTKRAKRSRAHSAIVRKRGATSGRKMRRQRNARKRTRRSM